ncbi:DUF550 domain-containing protein [Klebsiella pneumoniae]|jgi:hypothetical protein|uniref:DUF550 domain-containing protein n=1 Tax=Klebsiella pneumoniae TaxID=573 RepID=UPI0004504B3C|nr:DUF550 domain-containing protein [Klebsiella pneumoniae]DAG51791.1 MAG TPA: Protein of unknown function (DUF550) [Caudoviricetes sp.]EWD19171.1 hypothetical protein P845_00306 [Klebsiella pneumoniae UCI 42]MDI7012433.1 DUF550 domain-containing protein [Klebsiella pneumoniae]MDI7061019.1 DUF550 domain-containing protein [Klebsiella pneumoniae]MDI7099516.1 DUF550 domain-containing protein [Klebsiella pneumoniae]
MTKSTITRERLEQLADNNTICKVSWDERIELAQIALAAMNSEPFAYIIQDKYERERGVDGYLSRSHVSKYVSQEDINEHEITCTPLYRHAQPAPERDQVRIAHAEWSQATFGNVGPVGPLKHLSKEALEAAAEPGDLSEWADMQFLLWDAQRRAGITDEQITQAMVEKLAVNKQRKWPEPKDGEPRLHIKEQPAPVVNEVLYKLANHIASSKNGLPDEWQDWADELETDIRRAAMLAAVPQPQNAPQNIPEIIPNELIAAVNRLLDSNGSRGCYNAIKCYDAHIEVERLLAAARQEVNHG